MRVAAIASMKRGLEPFIHRELRLLEECGAQIVLLPTKQGPGPYQPHETWEIRAWSRRKVLSAQLARFAAAPRRYVRVMAEAIVRRAVVEFLLAAYLMPVLTTTDVIYATFADRKLFVGYFGKQLVGIPLVVEVHAYELYDNPNPRLFAAALAASDRVITISEHNRELLEKDYGLDREHVELVRYSLDLDEFRMDEKFTVLVVAFFVERKGHEILLRAVKELADPSIEVWIVGDEGSETRSVDVPRLVRELRMENQVAFFGRQTGTSLKALYRECDVFCLPCRFDSVGIGEGFPNAIIEAMAFGKPVITTRHVEIPRLLSHVLVDENDVTGLAQAIGQVRADTAMRRKLGSDNRKLTEQLFSAANAERTADILAAAARTNRET